MADLYVDPNITELWIKVYEAVRQAWEQYGSAPSQFELMRACNCSSTSIQNAFKALRARGHITAPKFGARVAKPVHPDRVLARYPPDPWAELDNPAPRIWK